MYSPGIWHLRVPRERKRNLRFRLFVLRRCRENPRFREAVMQMCREDILFFVNTFVWQFNPNSIGHGSATVGPFITWQFQDDAFKQLLSCIQHRSDCVIEKSREMGASWICLIIMLWFFLFHPMSKFLCVSRNADAVDDREDSDSLFWKLDYMLDHLPEWMIERKDYSRKVMSFKNHANGSMITGQATTGKAGVGGRCLAMFVDEFSQIDEAWEVYDRTSDTTSCRIFNGTHTHPKTCFNELCQKADPSINLVKLKLHWTLHPDKCKGLYEWDRFAQRVRKLDPDYVYPADFRFVTDGTPAGGPCPGIRSPWYDAQCKRKGTSRAIASDLDINPSGSVEQVFDPLLIKDLKLRYAKPPVAEVELEWNREDARPVRFHEKPGAKVKLWQPLSGDGKPAPGYYGFAADIATGTGATPSCLCGVNLETGEKVLEYADEHIEPRDFTYLSVALARMFLSPELTEPKLIWEIPGPGNTFTKHALILGYRSIWLRSTENRLSKSVSDSPGWANNPEAMKSLIEDYKDALRNRDFVNRSEFALSECLAFRYAEDGYVYHSGWKDPKDPSGARINHGDRVVADALCWKLVHESKRLIGLEGKTIDKIPPSQQKGSLAWRQELARIRARSTESWA